MAGGSGLVLKLWVSLIEWSAERMGEDDPEWVKKGSLRVGIFKICRSTWSLFGGNERRFRDGEAYEPGGLAEDGESERGC